MITLSFTGSEEEVISGIPRFVEITSSSPATIYYTLDGTLPTPLSDVYTTPVQLPTSETTVTLSAVGYYSDGYGGTIPTSVLSNVYRPDVSGFETSARYYFFEGIVYSYPGGEDIPIYYDSSGQVALYVTEEYNLVDNIESDRNADGTFRDVANVNIVPKVPPPQTDNANSLTFDPNARYITIDGRNGVESGDGYANLINGPYMSMRDHKNGFGAMDYYSTQGNNYRSGALKCYHYDRDRELVVFYYSDTKDNRWVRSIQRLEPLDTSSLTKPRIGLPGVFKWFQGGRQIS